MKGNNQYITILLDSIMYYNTLYYNRQHSEYYTTMSTVKIQYYNIMEYYSTIMGNYKNNIL